MTHPPQDPTAGTTARHIREHPDQPQPINDPTDPRNGQLPQPSDGRPISDPTDRRKGSAA